MACAVSAAFAALAACSTVVPAGLRGQVDRGVTYAQLARNPEAYQGRLVLMGGEVLRVEPGSRGLDLTLAARPLSRLDESPMLGEESPGDLVVLVPGGAAGTFREGNVVTVVGAVVGRAAGDILPPVPRLESRSIYVWPLGMPQPPGGELRW